MAHVHIPADLVGHTGGVDSLSIDARRIDELLGVLRARFPVVADELERMAVAIDGCVYHQATFEPIGPDSDIYFVPPIAGG
jgi:hypothetical protein